MQFLKDFNFKNTNSDKCVFVGEMNECVVYLGLYVNDGFIVCRSVEVINDVLDYLKIKFKITCGEANEFVGMKIQRDRVKHRFKISQPGYIAKILERFGIKIAKTLIYPAEPS